MDAGLKIKELATLVGVTEDKIILGPDADSRWHRDLGKEIFLGLNNGRSAYSIYESLARLGFGKDLDDVHGMILRYDMAFEGIKTWRDNIASTSLKEGVVLTKLGRRLKVSRDPRRQLQITTDDNYKCTFYIANPPYRATGRGRE